MFQPGLETLYRLCLGHLLPKVRPRPSDKGVYLQYLSDADVSFPEG